MEHKSNNHIWPWAIDETRDVNAEMRRACWMYQKRFNVAPTLVISAPGLALQPVDELTIQQNFTVSPAVFYFARPVETDRR